MHCQWKIVLLDHFSPSDPRYLTRRGEYCPGGIHLNPATARAQARRQCETRLDGSSALQHPVNCGKWQGEWSSATAQMEESPARSVPGFGYGSCTPVHQAVGEHFIFSESPALKRSPRLLIIEDEPVLLKVLGDYYAGRGIEVACAESLAAAREHLAKSCFDAVLLDINLPDGNGLSLLGLVPPERALAITSRPDPQRFEKLGLRYVPKPFDMSTLTRALEGILSSAPA